MALRSKPLRTLTTAIRKPFWAVFREVVGKPKQISYRLDLVLPPQRLTPSERIENMPTKRRG
jgi:hypothetical protein